MNKMNKYTAEEVKFAESWMEDREAMVNADLERMIKMHLAAAGVAEDITNQVEVMFDNIDTVSVSLKEDKYIDGAVNINLSDTIYNQPVVVSVCLWNEEWLDGELLNKYLIVNNALTQDYRFHKALENYMVGLAEETEKYRKIANF